MQIPKTLLTFAAALCLVAPSARAVDTEADLKLREALHQRMAEIGPETPARAPAPSKPAKPAKPAKTVKAPAQPAPVAKPVAPVAPTPVKAPPVAKPAAPVVAAPVKPAPVVVQPAPVAVPAQPVPAAVDEAEAERLREALRVRMEQEKATATPPPQVVTHGSDLQPAVSTTKVVTPKGNATATVKAPAKPAAVTKPVVKAPVVLVAPALPIPASKEARLAELLQKYKTDQITPQEYHEQRAKVIAE